MKPRGADKNDTGLLEYLEDIIGTDKYVEAIEMNAKKCALLEPDHQPTHPPTDQPTTQCDHACRIHHRVISYPLGSSADCANNIGGFNADV